MTAVPDVVSGQEWALLVLYREVSDANGDWDLPMGIDETVPVSV